MASAGMDTYERDAEGQAAGASSQQTASPRGPSSQADSLLASVRRLTRLADSASEPQEVFRALAAELFAELACEEVQVHHLSDDEDLVSTYMFGGEGRIGYRMAPGERPPGVSWVVNTAQSVVVTGARELAASMPRLAMSGGVGCALLLPLAVRGEVEAVTILTRRPAGRSELAGGQLAGGSPGLAGGPSGLAGGAHGLAGGPPDLFDARAIQSAATLVDQAATALALLRARAEAGTDPVTSCMNHRAMRRRLEEEIGRATRTGGQLSCLLIDLDNFKQVNDRHGHAAGDAVLRGVAHALMGEFRAFDRVARYGGDEFVVILAGADLQSAVSAGARARERMLGVSSYDVSAGVSASIGVAQWRAPMTTDQLLDACDAALLHGKRNGKGQVTRAA